MNLKTYCLAKIFIEMTVYRLNLHINFKPNTQVIELRIIGTKLFSIIVNIDGQIISSKKLLSDSSYQYLQDCLIVKN